MSFADKFKKILSKQKEIICLFFDKVRKDEWLSFIAVFVFFLLLNAAIYLTVSNVSSTDDQWFYFKVASLLRTEGWGAITHFQGAYFTNLSQSGYSYAAGLYHYFLMLFSFLPDKIMGLKLSGLFFASLVPALSYSVLRKFGFQRSFWWVIAFYYVIGSFNFTWRLFINRPFVLVDALLLIEIYLIFRKKYWPLFFVSIINTWWHPATFWLPVSLAAGYFVISLLHQKKNDYRSIIAATAGSLGGFLLFPWHSHTFLSPANPFYFIKTLVSFVYGLGNGPGLIEGGENYKGDVFGLITKSNIIFICLILLVVANTIFYIYRRKNNVRDLDKNEERAMLREYVFLITIIIFLGYLFSQRFEDLLVPLVMIGSATMGSMLVENGYLELKNGVVRKVLSCSILIILMVMVGNRVLDLRKSIGSDEKFLAYQKAGDWLKNNTKKGEIVFNTDFGQFNRLFFFDSWNRYIVGIEPKNMYEFNPKYYWLWHNITLNGIAYDLGNYAEVNGDALKGKNEEELKDMMVRNARNMSPVIRNTFQSQYIFFDGDTFLRKELDKDPDDYALVYQDKEAGIYIYKIKNS